MNTPDFSKLSDDELRIAVAKELGWVNIHYGSKGSRGTNDDGPEYWQGISPISKLYEPLPNYPASLDACREFEKQLDIENHDQYEQTELDQYCSELFKIKFEVMDDGKPFTTDLFDEHGWPGIVLATPRQRCIAFLTMLLEREKSSQGKGEK